jgi:hypothetical protein
VLPFALHFINFLYTQRCPFLILFEFKWEVSIYLGLPEILKIGERFEELQLKVEIPKRNLYTITIFITAGRILT